MSDMNAACQLPTFSTNITRHRHSEDSASDDIRLIHTRLPKVATNIQGRSTTVQTPPPVPWIKERLRQLEKIFAPLNLSLLISEEEALASQKNVFLTKANRDIQLKIVQSLIRQDSKAVSLAALHIKAQELEANGLQVLFPSSKQILNKTERCLLKEHKENVPSRKEAMSREKTKRLSEILEAVAKLDASVKVKNKTWMYKPRIGTATSKLRSQLSASRQLRKKLILETEQAQFDKDKFEDVIETGQSPSKCSEPTSDESASASTTSRSIPNQSDDPMSSNELEDTSIKSTSRGIAKQKTDVSDDATSRMPPPPPPCKSTNDIIVHSPLAPPVVHKPVLTKAQLKHIPKKIPRKSRLRILTLQRKVKIRPGTLFKSRRTKQKFTFTTVHRTITECGLALLAAAYALRSGVIHQESQRSQLSFPEITKSVTSDKNSTQLQNWLNSFEQTPSIRELARLKHSQDQLASTQDQSSNSKPLKANCYCQKTSKSKVKKTTKELKSTKGQPQQATTSNGSNNSNSSMVLVNRYTQPIYVGNPDEFPPGGYFDHTIQLLSYAKDLERRIHTLQTEGIMIEIGTRPVLKFYPRKPMGNVPVPTVALERNSMREALDQGVCDILAHSGFAQASLSVIEMLSEVMETFYTNFSSKLKGVMDKEVVEMTHGFLDPIDRVSAEMGLEGGVRGLSTYYETDVRGRHDTVERRIDKLENKFGTLIAYKKLEAAVNQKWPELPGEERKRLLRRFKERLYRPTRPLPESTN